MSYDEADAWEEAAMDSIYEQVTTDPAVKQQFDEEFYDEIVKDFTENRLRSFYEEKPDIGAAAVAALNDGRMFLATHHTAAFMFAAVAAEVGLTATLFKPIVHGLVRSETAAGLITKLAIKHSDENLTKILMDILSTHGGVDPRKVKQGGSAQTVWEELSTVRRTRNRVFHQADTASLKEAQLAVNVVAAILEEFFPAVVAKLGLHLHGSRVCAALNRPER